MKLLSLGKTDPSTFVYGQSRNHVDVPEKFQGICSAPPGGFDVEGFYIWARSCRHPEDPQTASKSSQSFGTQEILTMGNATDC